MIDFLKDRLGLGNGLHGDIVRLIFALSVTSISSGYISVVRSIYLTLLGFTPVQIGLLMTIDMISGALRATLFGVLADRYGRKPILLLVYLTTIPFYLVYLFSADYLLFVLAAIFAGTGAVGFGGVVQQALITEKVGDTRRNAVFSLQFFVSSACATLGTLLSGVPEIINVQYGLDTVSAVKPLFIIGILLVGLSIFVVLPVSEKSKPPAQHRLRPQPRVGFKRSWRLAAKFSAYYTLSSFGARIIMPLFSLWFYLNYQMDMKTVGYVFTASKAVETFAYLLGPPLSKRLGIVKTVVITRMGGVLCVALIPFAPTPLIAALLYTGRNAIQHISLPLRQSYMMAVLKPEERASTAGIVQLSSTATSSLAPTLGGYLMQEISTSLPLFISATIFTVSNLLFYVFFGRIKPPEEERGKK